MKGKPIEPGCLALIVGARTCKENIGRVVRVLRQPAPFESVCGRPKVTPWDANAWLVAPLPGQPDLLAPIVEKTTRTLLYKEPTRLGCSRQKNLIRLDDDEAPKQATTPASLTQPKETA